MRSRLHIVTIGLMAGAVGAWSTACGGPDRQQPRPAATMPAGEATTDGATAQTQAAAGEPRIFFRYTGTDHNYGLVASVPLADPGAEPEFTGVACDRVDVADEVASCLLTERGTTTRYLHRTYDADWKLISQWRLAGAPSRTRLSPSGRLVASTSFAEGHAYEPTEFSTTTTIRGLHKRFRADLETFSLTIGGKPRSAPDRNIWGVTFVDDEQFFATVATGDRTYLVSGDLVGRSLRSLTENAECPSVSPDGKRVAFKVEVDRGSKTVWQLAVYDVTTGARTLLSATTRGLDDQAEWLDDDTLLYGLASPNQAGVTDVWQVDTTPTAEPRLLIRHAWSPAVVHESAPQEQR